MATSAVAVLSAAAFGAPVQVHAQEAAEAQQVQEVVVTGSRIRRSSTDSTAPIDVVTAQDMTDRGFVSAGQALNIITANTPAFPAITSVNGPAGSGQTYPNLFNLGPGRTLTLVDGKRFVSTSTPVTSSDIQGAGSAVDTNLIPIGLLDHVEVVQGGGAAVYGSDAIAGVVNYVLKRSFTGAEFDVQTGISSRGDRAQNSARATLGTNFDEGRGNVALDVEYAKTEPLRQSDRSFEGIGRYSAGNIAVHDARFYEFNPNGVLFSVPAPVPVCGGANCFVRINGVPQQFSPDGKGLTAYNPGINGVTGGAGLTPPFASGGEGYPLSSLSALSTGVTRYTANLLSHYDITEHLKVSGALLYNHTRGDDPVGSQGYSRTILNPAASGVGPVVFNKTNPYLTAEQIAALSAASPAFANGGNLYLSKIFSDILPTDHFLYLTDTYRGQVGLDGDFNVSDHNFYYGVSYSHGVVRSQQRGWDVNTVNFNNAINSTTNSAGQIVCAINAVTVVDPACSPINPFGAGNTSEAARRYATTQVGYTYKNRQDDLLATLGGDLIKLPGGTSKFSVAYEHRAESADFIPSLADQQGLISTGVATPPTSGSYNTNEFSGELLIPLVGGDFTLPFMKALELNAQGRLVDNSLAGHNTVWGVGLRWQVNDSVALRFSRSQNFRAPTLYQLAAPQKTSLEGGIQDPCDSRYINAGPTPQTRRANCLALFQANPLYGTGTAGGAPVGADAATRLAGFTDTAANFNTAQVTTGGNAALDNEVSQTFTYGVVFQPRWVPGQLTITADYISVRLTNGLTPFTPTNFTQSCFDSAGGNSPTCGFFTRDDVGNVATAVSTTYNAASLKYQGENFTFDYRFPFDWITRRDDSGAMELQLNATHNENLTQVVAGATTQAVGTINEPRWVVRGDVRYAYGPLRLTYEAFYLPSAYWAEGANASNTPTPVVKSNLRHSISASYDFGGRYQVRAGIDNLTDKLVSDPTFFYGDYVGRFFWIGLQARY